ncbi:hypothetical protein [Dyadobacter sp. CY261]|uniref:hypothetical protein n=1 Tax=Dyadobacter sp. CY261 TaxID=2907203 RepID=UPI00271547A5|nr:hypothetical protein [Dyadobacter sp. CY261]
MNVFPILLPPLRERKSDIAPLALFFAQNFCKEFGKELSGISDAMMDELLAYQWPGNIRELENVIQRSVILNDSRSQLNLTQSLGRKAEDISERVDVGNLADVKRVQMNTERAYIISILKKAKGAIRGIGGAAELLNLKPTTLESKMARLGITKEDYNNPSGEQSGL